MPLVSLLHTSGIHIDTFERLLKEAAPDMRLRHAVREDWLSDARRNGLTEALSRDVGAYLERVAERADAVICSCSSLGPLADEAAKAHPNVIRADRPMMQAAARTAGTTIVALCLESTRGPTLEILREAYAEIERAEDIDVVDCGDAWPFFEAREKQRFGETIAELVRRRVTDLDRPGCVVLAQPSMAASEPFLADVGVPVLSAPALAARAALDLIGR